METTTSALMTEQQFISMFKEKGFELYKTEELKKQIQDRDKTTDEQSLRLINLFDASLSENQPVISEEEIKKIFPDEATMIGRAKFAETTPEETDANLRGQKWMKMFIEDMIEHLSLSSNDKQEKKPTEQIKVGDRVVVNSNCEDKTFFGKEGIVEDRYFELCKVRFENDQCRAYSEYKLNKVEKICPQTGDACSYVTEKCKDKCTLSKHFIKPL